MKLKIIGEDPKIIIKIRHNYYNHIWSNLIFVIPMFIISFYSILIESNLIPLIISIIIVVLTNRNQKLVIDKSNRSISIKNQNYEIKNDNQLILNRRNKIYRGMSKTTHHTTKYLGTLVIHYLYLKIPEIPKIVLLKHDPIGFGNTSIIENEDVLYAFNKVAELISKELKIPIIDQTGIVETKIDYDKTDAFIAKRFIDKKLNYDTKIQQVEFGTTVTLDKNIHISKNEESNYVIDTITDPINFWDIFRYITSFIIIMISAYFIYKIYKSIPDLTNVSASIKIATYVTAGFLILLGLLIIKYALFIIINSFDHYYLEISPTMATVKIKSLLLMKEQTKVDLKSIERIIIFKIDSGYKHRHHFLELATNEKRIKTFYSGDKDQLIMIREIIIELLVYLLNNNWIKE